MKKDIQDVLDIVVPTPFDFTDAALVRLRRMALHIDYLIRIREEELRVASNGVRGQNDTPTGTVH